MESTNNVVIPVENLVEAWFPQVKQREYSRPEVYKIEVQKPLLPDTPYYVLFWVWLDGAAHRVDIRLTNAADLEQAGANALENWFYDYETKRAKKGPQRPRKGG